VPLLNSSGASTIAVMPGFVLRRCGTHHDFVILKPGQRCFSAGADEGSLYAGERSFKAIS